MFVGLDHAPPTFDVKNRILGAGVSTGGCIVGIIASMCSTVYVYAV